MQCAKVVDKKNISKGQIFYKKIKKERREYFISLSVVLVFVWLLYKIFA